MRYLIGVGLAILLAGVAALMLMGPENQAALEVRPHEVATLETEAATEPQPGYVRETEDQYETVLGLSVRKDRDCTVSLMPYIRDGETHYAYQCISDQPPEPHRYATLTIDELKALAYADSAAAEILAIRLIEAGDEAGGLEYIYRSVALESGKRFDAIVRAHNTFYASGVSSKAPDWEPTPDFHAMEQAYIFSRIRDRLTDGARYADYDRQRLETHGFSDFARLEKEVDKALKAMAATEIEVVGDNQIQGAIDA